VVNRRHLLSLEAGLGAAMLLPGTTLGAEPAGATM